MGCTCKHKWEPSLLSRNRKEVECVRSWLWLEQSGLSLMSGRIWFWASRKGNKWQGKQMVEGIITPPLCYDSCLALAWTHWMEPTSSLAGPKSCHPDVRKRRPSRHMPPWHHQVPLPFHFLPFWEGGSHGLLHVILDIWHCLVLPFCIRGDCPPSQ